MTRKEFNKHVLYVEQDTGITGDPEEIEELWLIWQKADPFIAKIALRIGLILWHYDEISKAHKQKHFKN